MELSELLRLTNLFAFAFCIRALGGDALGEKDGKEGDQDNEHRNDIGDRPVTRKGELREDPDRQRGLLSGRECGDDHLVERKCKCQHPTGQKRRGDIRKDDITKGLKGIRAEVLAHPGSAA